MSIVAGSLQNARATTAAIAASAAIPLDGQIVYNSQTGQYKIGDGVTALSALTYYGGAVTSGLTVGTTTITSGTNTRILYNNSGVVGEYSVTGTGTTAVLSTSPTFTTDITTPLIIGGTAVGSTITLKSTSGIGTTTGAGIIGLVGNNGATTSHTIYNDGQFIVGTNTRIGGALGVFQTNINGGLVTLGAQAASTGAIWIGQATPTNSNWVLSPAAGSTSLYVNAPNGGFLVLSIGTGNKLQVNNSSIAFTPSLANGSSIAPFTFTAPANTGQVASSNVPIFKVTGNIQQWTTGALATQYFNYFSANTVSFIGASTATLAANFVADYVQGGTNATITTNAAIYVPTLALSNTTTAYGIYSVAPTGATTNKALALDGNAIAKGQMFITDSLSATPLGYDLEVNKAVNGGVESWVRNTTNGTAAFAQFASRGNSTQQIKNGVTAAAFTNSGLYIANMAYILSVAVDQFLIGNQTTTKPIIFVNGGTTATDEVFRISATNTIDIYEARNLTFGTTTGTKLGTATTQKIGFWNATPIVQPTTAVAASTLTSNGGTTLTSTDTIDGYTLLQVVKALRNTGLLA